MSGVCGRLIVGILRILVGAGIENRMWLLGGGITSQGVQFYFGRVRGDRISIEDRVTNRARFLMLDEKVETRQWSPSFSPARVLDKTSLSLLCKKRMTKTRADFTHICLVAIIDDLIQILN